MNSLVTEPAGELDPGELDLERHEHGSGEPRPTRGASTSAASRRANARARSPLAGGSAGQGARAPPRSRPPPFRRGPHCRERACLARRVSRCKGHRSTPSLYLRSLPSLYLRGHPGAPPRHGVPRPPVAPRCRPPPCTRCPRSSPGRTRGFSAGCGSEPHPTGSEPPRRGRPGRLRRPAAPRSAGHLVPGSRGDESPNARTVSRCQPPTRSPRVGHRASSGPSPGPPSDRHRRRAPGRACRASAVDLARLRGPRYLSRRCVSVHAGSSLPSRDTRKPLVLQSRLGGHSCDCCGGFFASGFCRRATLPPRARRPPGRYHRPTPRAIPVPAGAPVGRVIPAAVAGGAGSQSPSLGAPVPPRFFFVVDPEREKTRGPEHAHNRTRGPSFRRLGPQRAARRYPPRALAGQSLGTPQSATRRPRPSWSPWRALRPGSTASTGRRSPRPRRCAPGSRSAPSRLHPGR